MKPKYGIDAPKAVRNLFLASLLALVFMLFTFQIQNPVWFWIAFFYFATVTVSLLFMGCWNWVIKPKVLSQLIEKLGLKGDEMFLDVGCGSGMFLIEAAKKLPQGKAHGIDLWFSKHQSKNKMEKTIANAEAENVRSRIEVHTADMRSLPFPDATFDAVVSCLAIHNIPDEIGRDQALFEILRVLKPGGKLCIFDIHFAKQYAVFIEQTRMAEIICSNPLYLSCLSVRIIQGKKL